MSERKLASVTNLRTAPSLTDIAGQLRQLADQIERGDYADRVRAAYVLIEAAEMRPHFHAWGDIRDRHGMAGLFLHAAQLALTDADE